MATSYNQTYFRSKATIDFDINGMSYQHEYFKNWIDGCFVVFEPIYDGEQYFGFIEDWSCWQTDSLHWNDIYPIRRIVGIQDGLFGGYEFIYEKHKYSPSRSYYIKNGNDVISEWILKQTKGLNIDEVKTFTDKFMSARNTLYKEYNLLKDVFRNEFLFTDKEANLFVHVIDIVKYFPFSTCLISWKPSECRHMMTFAFDFEYIRNDDYCFSYDMFNGFAIDACVGKNNDMMNLMKTNSLFDVIQYVRELMRENQPERLTLSYAIT